MIKPIPTVDDRTYGRRWYAVALLGVLFLAAWLRFGGITQVGIRFEDEGWYVSDARLWHRCMRVISDTDAIGAVLRRDKQAVKERMDAIGVDFTARYAKPSQGYTFLGALMMFAVGDRPAALLVTNALCGLLTVVALYALGITLFDRRVALCGAFLLAVSPYHLVYCRSALAETSAGLFVLIGALLWALGFVRRWPWRRAYFLSGMVFGYAAACHYRNAYIPLALFLVELLSRGRSGPAATSQPSPERNTLPRRWALSICGFAVPLLAIEGVFRVARLAAVVSDSYLPLATFFESGWHKIARVHGVGPAGGVSWIGEMFGAYVSYFVHWHGVAAAVLTGLGLLITLRAKGAAKLPGMLVLVTAGLLLCQRYKMARVLSTMVPFLCLLLAVGVVALVSWRPSAAKLRVVLTVALLFAAAGPALFNAWHLYGKRSFLKDACAFVAHNGGGTLAVTNRCRFRLYLERSGMTVISAQKHLQEEPLATVVERLRADGVRWVITEPQHWSFWPGSVLFQQWHGLNEQLTEQATLVAQFPHASDYRWELLAEGQWAGLANLSEMTRQGGGPLRVYDLRTPQATAGAAELATTREQQDCRVTIVN